MTQIETLNTPQDRGQSGVGAKDGGVQSPTLGSEVSESVELQQQLLETPPQTHARHLAENQPRNIEVYKEAGTVA